VAITLWVASRKRKELSYSVLSNYQLFVVPDRGIKEKLKVTFNGEPVRSPRLIVIGFRNTGNRDIFRDDFEQGKPITLSFGKRCRVLDADFDDPNPQSLEPNVRSSGDHEVEVKPLLLNKGDSFSAKVLVSGRFDEKLVNVSGRIKGVKDIQKRTTLETYGTRIKGYLELALLLATFPIAMLGMSAASSPKQSQFCALLPQLESSQCAIAGLVIPVIWLLGALFLRSRARRAT
jgi:hypothetical protein